MVMLLMRFIGACHVPFIKSSPMPQGVQEAPMMISPSSPEGPGGGGAQGGLRPAGRREGGEDLHTDSHMCIHPLGAQEAQSHRRWKKMHVPRQTLHAPSPSPSLPLTHTYTHTHTQTPQIHTTHTISLSHLVLIRDFRVREIGQVGVTRRY